VVDKGDCVARHSRYCTGFFRCPDYDSDALADFLIRLAEEKNLKDWLLLPSNDHAVVTLSRNKARLETVFKVITPGRAVQAHRDQCQALAVGGAGQGLRER
jgi:predicted ATP-grasp superfamily ATP-dependent carboligase